MCSQKEISYKAGDNYGKICNATPATFLSSEDSNYIDGSQNTKQRNSVLSRLDPNNKSGLSERDFVDDRVLPKNVVPVV